MGTTRLGLYNKALLYSSEPPLATLSDESKGRRVMDEIWASNLIDDVLSEGLEGFALGLELAPGAPVEATIVDPASTSVQVIDNDSVGTFAFAASEFTVLEDGTLVPGVSVALTCSPPEGSQTIQ